MESGNRISPLAGSMVAFAACALIGAGAIRADDGAQKTSQRLVRNGVVVEFEVRTLLDGGEAALMEGGLAEIRFRLSEEASGKPLQGVTPGAWLDLGDVMQAGVQAQQRECKDKIALYLQGAVGIRPMVDLNSYFVLLLNRDASVSVVDPVVSMAGMTSTLATIRLEKPGADWARHPQDKQVFVTMPTAGEVAVIDAESFKLKTVIAAGAFPTRIAVQPDGHYVWVGNDAEAGKTGGVTVIDASTNAVVAALALGAGHHEMAFTADSRFAFVTSRDSGTLSMIDVASLARVAEIRTGPLPISLAYSDLSRRVYVPDGKDGSVSVVDPASRKVVKTIRLKPGLGPMRFTHDGRWGFVVNPHEDMVHLIDASDDSVRHDIRIGGQPYQVVFSRAFAYVRALASERVSMVNLSSLGAGKTPTVLSFAAGSGAPSQADGLLPADSIANANTEAAVMVVNPVENTTYFYMEGMNAPSSSYVVKGSAARAVLVVDRSLKEISAGEYAGKVKWPAAGRYDVAFLLESPQILHCFTAQVGKNPAIARKGAPLQVTYLSPQGPIEAGGEVTLRFRLTDPVTGQAAGGIGDARVLYYRYPGQDRAEVAAREVGDGIYEASLRIERPGAYAVNLGALSRGVRFGGLPVYSLVLRAPAAIGADGKPRKPD
jgi:YVTN family beta-propeller protein